MDDDADDELDQESEDELEEEEEEGEDEEDDGNNNEDEEDDEEEEEEEQVNQKIAFHASPKNVFMSTLNNYRSNMNHETNRRQINSSGNFYHKSYQNIPIGHPNQSPFSFRNRGQQKVNTSRISSSSSSNSNSNLGSSEDGEVGMDIDTNTNKNISTLTQTSNQSTLLPFSKATAAQFLVELKKAQEQQTQKRQEENQETFNENLEMIRDTLHIQLNSSRFKSVPTNSLTHEESQPTSTLVPFDISPSLPFRDWVSIRKNMSSPDTKYIGFLPYSNDRDLESIQNQFLEYYDLTDEFEEKDEDTFTVLPIFLKKYYPNIFINGTVKSIDNIFLDTLASHLEGEYSRIDLRSICQNIVDQQLGANIVPKKVATDIDSANLPQNTDPEATMDSFHTLFCRRCYRYDCQLHDPTAPSNFKNTPSIEITSDSSVMCEKSCYKDPDTPKALEVVTLDKHEEALFKVALTTCGRDSCAIALIVESKNCSQIYQLLNASAPNLNDLQENQHTRKKKQQKSTIKSILVKSKSYKPEFRQNYEPCDHPGQSCSKETCPCVQGNNFCEKYCGCPNGCSNRFLGCKCKLGNCETQCLCKNAERECDPVICINCCPGNASSNEICRNTSIQRRLSKKTTVARSDVAGWGTFILEPAKKGDLISEYAGELVSQQEGERRGFVYDQVLQTSFLFGVNTFCDIDSMRRGNKIRFANHSKKYNCFACMKTVNGDHRIGIYAARDIAIGEELLFDYGYNHALEAELISKRRVRAK